MDNVILIEQAGRTDLRLIVDDSLEIGRDCDGLILVDERVSRRHLRVDNDQGRLVVTDLGSSNGTYLDGDRISTTVALLPKSQVTLGSTTITLLSTRAVTQPATSRQTVVVTDATSAARPTSIENVAKVVTENVSSVIQNVAGHDDTVTIMFSDIESSTEKALSMGDVAWMSILHRHNEIFEKRVAEHRGTIIKNQGDGYMVTFGSARRAVLCCSQVQRDLLAHSDQNPHQAIRVRMGCHTGEAIHESGDLFGRHVIIAARVANLAQGGQILVSSIVKEITAARGDLAYGDGLSVDLKGVEDPHIVYDLDWSELGATASAS